MSSTAYKVMVNEIVPDYYYYYYYYYNKNVF